MATRKTQNKKTPPTRKQVRVLRTLARPFTALHHRVKSFLKRRPHRSFRITRRRDYRRSLQLPGYFAFSNQVIKLLWANKKTFMLMVVVFSLVSFLLVGFASQDIISSLRDGLEEADQSVFVEGIIGDIEKTFILFASTISGEVYGIAAEDQKGFQLFSAMIALLTWLTTVWIIRNVLAGYTVKVRDAIYNAGAPILSTFIVVLVLVVQLIPLAIAIIGYTAAAAAGILNGGVETMLFWVAAGLLTILSLYWITATFIALVVVTLPGMYPFKALRIAGDMVVGRRLRILLRVMWMLAGIGLLWILVMIPIILFDGWIKGLLPAIEGIPIVPVALLLMISVTLIWSSSYIYLLYRKVVEDDALPA